MVDLTDLGTAIAAISRDLAVLKVQHAITFGVAMAVHGCVRATRDIDLLFFVESVRMPGRHRDANG